ncbi:MAG TPA: DnaD domain protein [Chloroflexi bacterium]|nr:DnaD domain protein [Chloroflexota bacterium]
MTKTMKTMKTMKTIKTFSGFPAGKVHSTRLPDPIFTELIPLIDDLLELKLTLHVMWRLGQQSGKVRYLSHADLADDAVLLSSLGNAPLEALQEALHRAVERGSLLKVETARGEITEAIYFANTPKGRRAIEAIERGEWPDDVASARRTDIFTLYEQNVGLLTPIIAEELRQAEDEYPIAWIEEAIREATMLNKRSWKYIRAILERWTTEGRGVETHRRGREADRRRYLEWKQSASNRR